VADVIARAHCNLDKIGLEAERTARIKQQSADIVNELKEAFRTKFYADDKPAKVEPAGRRGRQELQGVTRTPRPCRSLWQRWRSSSRTPAGNITPAVVAPKKHKPGDPLRKQWRLAWDLRQAKRLIRSYALPTPTIAELEQRSGGANEVLLTSRATWCRASTSSCFSATAGTSKSC
jgi:hypothetical protein